MRRIAIGTGACVLCLATQALADLLPSRPIVLWNERLVVSGEVTLTVGSLDRGYFNALDYSHDAFNLLTMTVSAELRAHERIAVVGEALSETAQRFIAGNAHRSTDYIPHLIEQDRAWLAHAADAEIVDAVAEAFIGARIDEVFVEWPRVLGFFSPAASAPTDDIGEDEWKKKKRRENNAKEGWGWEDILPW